jgi:hypothetical protein
VKRAVAFAAISILAALAPAAHAGDRVDYAQMFTTSVPGASTGTDTQILYKNPNDPAAKPIPVRREVFTFPSGTSYDETVVPDCTASDAELMLLGPDACPSESYMGGSIGDTTMAGFDNTEQAADVFGWDQGGDLVLLGGSHDIQPIRFVAHARRVGQVVTVEVPRTPGGPPDGESALRRVTTSSPRARSARARTRAPRRAARARATGSSAASSPSPTASSNATSTGCPARRASRATAATPAP